MNVPIIQSVGPPPALHADRVTAEMLKYIVATHIALWRDIGNTFRNGSLGNPIGQQRLLRRLEAIGGAFLPVCRLNPGKRRHFTITLVEIAPWDQNRDAVITEDDPVPVKSWLAAVVTTLKGLGPDKFDTVARIPLVASHHALSRLCQRANARTPRDLIATDAMCEAFLVASKADRFDGVAEQRFAFTLPDAMGGGAVAVSEPYKGGDTHTRVVKTVLPPDAGEEMRDVNRVIEHIERTVTRNLDAPSARPPDLHRSRKPAIRAWRAPAGDSSQYAEAKKRSVFKEKTRMNTLSVTARAIKVSVPLDPAAVGALSVPNQERVELTVSCDGRSYAANVAAKSLRKVKTAISANGAEVMFVMLQGKLKGNEIIECGITAQVKAAKETKGATE
jgi:hypothetical protein